MKQLCLLLAGLALVTSQAGIGKEVGGVDVPETVTLQGSGEQLVLNGAGIRKKFFVNVYAGALYLPEKNPDAQAILDDTGAASVDMHILHSEISREQIVEGWEDGLRANLDREGLETIRPRLNEFNGMFRAVRKGDVIRIAYHPGTGTEVRINGEWHGAVAGNDFFRALLKIWLGTNPVTKSLKKAMLGQD